MILIRTVICADCDMRRLMSHLLSKNLMPPIPLLSSLLYVIEAKSAVSECGFLVLRSAFSGVYFLIDIV